MQEKKNVGQDFSQGLAELRSKSVRSSSSPTLVRQILRKGSTRRYDREWSACRGRSRRSEGCEGGRKSTDKKTLFGKGTRKKKSASAVPWEKTPGAGGRVALPQRPCTFREKREVRPKGVRRRTLEFNFFTKGGDGQIIKKA